MLRGKGSPAHPPKSRGVCLLAVLCVVVASVSVLVAGCDEDQPAAAGAGTRTVTFATEDGVTLSGHLFGSGEAGIILAHMYPADQTSWYPTAERLAQEGYLVLTFDFRGYGDSEGDKDIALIDRDALAALHAIADAGANRVVMLGASMGGTACLLAADASQPLSRLRVTGVVTLSAPVEFRGLSAADAIPRLQMPLLFIAAEDDVGAEGAQALMELSGGTGELELVPGDDHGTELLEGAQADRIWGALLDFLSANLSTAAR
jgi:pimeloyl-ACP methyl ester carboxylesterase